jgi:hypothetical protein
VSAINDLSRRRVLRGMLAGTAVTVALPLLECFLNENGTADAATGQVLPPCFGTWLFGLGLQPGWRPTESGNRYALTEQMTALAPIQAKINLYSGMQVFLDGKLNQNHYSGAQGQMTGTVSRTASEYSISLDQIIADQIGKSSRFRSIEVTCAGDRRASWSARGSNGLNPSEISPLALYTRIFGPEFQDPNAANFVPDPDVMLRDSVLSGVVEDRQALLRTVSAADRARIDEYFSSVRDLEQKLAVELQRPAALPACTVPPKLADEDIGTLVDQTRRTNQQFAQLLAHALSCGQTRVFNVTMGSSLSPMRKPGSTSGYHQLTHEEPIDAGLGYQVQCKWLAEQHMSFFRDFLTALDSIREGDGTLLDRTIVFAFTDHGEARLHSMKNYMVFTAGSGGGRMKTGYHLVDEGGPATRVGLTVLQALDIPNSGSWGTESNRVSKPFGEVLA